MKHSPRFHDDLDRMCASLLEDGMRLHVASTMSRPNALLLALARTARGRARFTVSSNAFHAHMHALVMADAVADADTCFAGDTYPSPRPNPVYARLHEGRPFPVREWSLLSFLQRLVAGAQRLPHAPTTSLVGSDLARELESELVPAPVTEDGERTVLVPALRPDITLLHAPCADRLGNLYLNGPLGEGVWGALAADRGVVATVERVLETPPPDAVSIPRDRVLAIHECPLGAHPQGLPPFPEAGVRGYPDDYRHLADLADACADPASRDAWAEQWITDPAAHGKHRALFAEERARVSPTPGTTALPEDNAPATARETHLVLAARAIADRARERGVRSLLAGIGMAHVATWLAALMLADDHPVQVHNELGMVDMRPGSGDAFLFAQANVERCRTFGGTLDVLGSLGVHEHALAVLSAAEVGRCGSVNSSRTATGAFLVGSGGANDFASRMETVIVAPASPRRYVGSVRFVTSPGHHVRTVVSQFGTLTRAGADDDFSLSTWLAPTGAPDSAPLPTLRERTCWPLPGDRTPRREAPVAPHEIRTLRGLDIEGIYR